MLPHVVVERMPSASERAQIPLRARRAQIPFLGPL